MKEIVDTNRRNKFKSNFNQDCKDIKKQIKLNKNKGLVTKLFDLKSVSVAQYQYFIQINSFIIPYNLSFSKLSIESNFLLLTDCNHQVCYSLERQFIKKLLNDIINEIIIIQNLRLHHLHICVNNIYVTKDGEFKLFDYFHRMLKVEREIDVINYFNISPEEAQEKEITDATDMWQIGMVIRQLIDYDLFSNFITPDNYSNNNYSNNKQIIDEELIEYADKLTKFFPSERITAKEMRCLISKKRSLDIKDYIHNRIDKAIIYNNGLFKYMLEQLNDVDIDLIGDLRNFIDYYYTRFVNTNDIKSFGFILHLAEKSTQALNLLKHFYFKPESPEELIIIGLNGKKELNLFKNGFTGENFKFLTKMLKYMKDIKKFNFGGNNLCINELEDLSYAIARMNYIENFSLFDCNINNNGIAKILPSIITLTNLKLLNLERNLIDEKGIKILCKSFESLNDLQEFNISFNPIGPKGMKVIAKYAEYITNLIKLDISHCRILPDGANYLYNYSKNFTNLEILNISYNSLLPIGGVYLSKALHSFNKLIYLDLSYNYIKSDSVREVLSSLNNATKLHTLDISGNAIRLPSKLKVQDSEFIWLNNSLPIINISVLYIDDNNLNSSDVELLCKYSVLFGNLQTFGISSNNIEDIKPIKKLVKSFNNLKEFKFKNNSRKIPYKDVCEIKKICPTVVLDIDEEENIELVTSYTHPKKFKKY